ncbi:alpha-glucan family phosphorylase [Geothrix sp. PMB-07]|uniref:alpha-glucan family phosphorylase n=1 Tax=Geothrix sp. PMB-07 TaxID=3068640 RepID=UPI0027404C9F|nr:alpha-glucan family phosphorylase [Geothrix sp. PMB-07]WLT31272.1 alpha-glucan family phosphorylase [Geothrix sp. PMB-07]
MDKLLPKLQKLTQNLWWTWKPEVRTIFRDLDLELYHQAHQNPMSVLKQIAPDQLEKRAADVDIPARVDRALRHLQEYLTPVTTWGLTHAGAMRSRPIAYFCMEFGIHESLPIYSGGLGILAGDHLKAASDLGVPLVGVGLLYHEGYTSQVLNAEFWQQDVVEPFDIADLPLVPALDRFGEPVHVSVELPGRLVHAAVLEVQVGRIRLILLDTRVKQNDPKDVALAARLYGGDQRMRIEQELLLGVGGARALRALDINASVFHLNEGHSAFALLERAHYRIQHDGLDPHTALQEVAAATVFTTHTPVDAGHDRFPADLAAEHLRPLAEGLKLPLDEVMGLGRVNPHDHGSPFLPTVLALKLSRRANGVSALHGVVSRKMWNHLYPGRREEEVPIGHVTNGVHLPTWLATEMHHLYESHLGVDYQSSLTRPATWSRITSVSSAEIWETKQVLKARTIRFIRERSAATRARLGLPEINPAPLDPDALTIGFARRFVPYKRPDLLFSDLDRLDRLVNNPERPVNLIFSGRAHPADNTGKGLIQKVAKILEDPRFRHRILFVENYNIHVGRMLYQGIDAWLNNPQRPLEACGTSGMKVVLNGGLHISVRDGWWAESYDGENGFAIGSGETHANQAIQDERDGDDLFRLLEEQVVPLYYENRNAAGVPRCWVDRQKQSIRTLAWRFNADRMVQDYVEHLYLPAAVGSSCQMPPP